MQKYAKYLIKMFSFFFLKLLKAILVLRIHLFEIEKVNELCKDFSERYIETLKIKLNSDNIFKSDDDSDEMNESNADERSFTLNSTEDTHESNPKDESDRFYKSFFSAESKCKQTPQQLKGKSYCSPGKFKAVRHVQQSASRTHSTPLKKSPTIPFEISPDTCLAKISFNMLNLNNDSSYQSVCDLEDELADNADSCDEMNKKAKRSNSSSNKNSSECDYDAEDYGNDELADDFNEEENLYEENDDEEDIEAYLDEDDCSTKSPNSIQAYKSAINSSPISNNKNSNPNGEDYFFKRNTKNKRGILPKNATNVMKKWLFQHIVVSDQVQVLYMFNPMF